MNTNEAELTSLQLLRDMQAELRDALNVLGGRQADGLLQRYPFYSAAFINRAVEGYIYLRESGRFDASKLLVRPALEAFIRVQAIRKTPELMFRIVFTEFQEDKKCVRLSNRPDIINKLQIIERRWQKFRQAYQSQYPKHSLTEEKLDLWSAAKSVGLDGYYNSHYRFYCHFTHATFRASTGDLNDFEVEDNRTMTRCAFAAVDSLNFVGAPAPNLPELKRRLSSK